MRIFVADDDINVLHALQLLLQHLPWVEIVGVAESRPALQRLVPGACPDVVMVDWEMLGRDESILFAQLRRLSPPLRIIASSSRPEARRQALAAGADAFVSKAESPEHLLAVLEWCRPAPAVSGN